METLKKTGSFTSPQEEVLKKEPEPPLPAPFKKYGALTAKLRNTIQATLLLGPISAEKPKEAAGDKKGGFADWKAKKNAAKDGEHSAPHRERRGSVLRIGGAAARRGSVGHAGDDEHGHKLERKETFLHQQTKKGHKNPVDVLGKLDVGTTWNDDSIVDYSPWIKQMPTVDPNAAAERAERAEREAELQLHVTADPFKTVQAAVTVNKLAKKVQLLRAPKAADPAPDVPAVAKQEPSEKVQEGHVRIRRARSQSAYLCIECKNLRGAFLGSKLDTKVVVSIAEEYISRKGKYYWVVVGQTEVVKSETNPAFKTSIEIDFDPGQPRLVRCDVFSSETSLKVDPSVHKGGFLLDIQELLHSESGKIQGGINPKPEVHEDVGHMQFDVMRQMREYATPVELMAAFKRADKDKNRQLDPYEFHEAVSDLARQKRLNITQEGETLAFRLCDFNGDGVLNYSEFIAMVYGRHGSISVMLEKQHMTVEEASESHFAMYRKDLQKEKKRRMGGGEDAPPHTASLYWQAMPRTAPAPPSEPEHPPRKTASKTAEQEEQDKRLAVKNAALRIREKAQVLLENTERAEVDWFLRQREIRLQQYHMKPRIPEILKPTSPMSPTSKMQQARLQESRFEEQDTRTHFIGHAEKRSFQVAWSKNHKGKGMVISSERGGSTATCNLLNESAGPCTVRTELPLPSSGSSFFEIVLERDGVQEGGSLDGPYSFGLASEDLKTWDGPWIEQDKELFCCWAISVCRPAQYDTSWSVQHKASEITVGEGGKSSIATFSLEGAQRAGGDALSRTSSAGIASAYRQAPRNPHEVVSFRAANALPRGTSYFEVTLKILGKVKGESLGGKCHIGLCSPAMQEGGWTGDWTKDERVLEAWTLNDNHAGQLSMAMLGVDSKMMSEHQINHRLREVFDSFDLNKSGTIDKSELRQALRDLGIFCTDEELHEMFSVIDSSGDGDLDYGEFVMMARSRASTGMIVHGRPETWVLNSFFGVGDAIGVQVDTVRKTATLFKNGRVLGQAFSHLPDVLFPFVTLSQPGMLATLTVSSARSIASRSEIIVGGLMRQWVEGSEFSCGDRVGLLVDMDSREVEMYKNGEHVGKAFERIPEKVYLFATLCHTGAVALLRSPPQPKPMVIDRMNAWLAQSTADTEDFLPTSGGSLHIGGSPGVTVATFPAMGLSDVARRVRLRAVDVGSVFNDEVLGLKGCRIVSPIVDVSLLHGPAFGDRAELSIPHFSYELDGLVIGYMAAASVNTIHRNVWQSLGGAVFDGAVGRARISASGYFCVLSYKDPALSKDVVEVSFDFDVAPGMPSFQSLATLDGFRVPQFGVLRVGGELRGTVHIAPKSCVDPRYASTKGAVPSLIGRGHYFEPILGEGRCLDDEQSFSFSHTEAFVAHGCTLSLQSLFLGQGQAALRWTGAAVDLPFKVAGKPLQAMRSYTGRLWIRGKFSSVRGDYEWHRRPFSFDYQTGVLTQLPASADDDDRDQYGQDKDKEKASPSPNSSMSQDVPIEVGRLPWMKVSKFTDPNTILPFALQIHSSGGATPVTDKVIIAAASEEDRDSWLVAFRCFDSLISGCPPTQLISVQLSVSAAHSDTIGTIHDQKPFAVLAPFSLSVMDHALKTRRVQRH